MKKSFKTEIEVPYPAANKALALFKKVGNLFKVVIGKELVNGEIALYIDEETPENLFGTIAELIEVDGTDMKSDISKVD